MEVVIHLVLVYCPQHRFEVFIQNMVRASQLQIMNAELVWRQSEILKDIDAHCKNIAKGPTDPRVEFILPKSYCKFKHKS